MLASVHLGKPALLTSLASLFLVGCPSNGGRNVQVSVGSSVQSFFSVQEAYASALQKALGSTDKSFQIVPVKLAAYARGSVLTRDNLADLLTAECRAGAAKLPALEDRVNDFPTINTSSMFSLSGDMSVDVAKVINDAASLGAKVSRSRGLTLGYEGGKQEVIPSDKMSRFIQEDKECFKAIAGKPVLFVRGQISSRMTLTSESKLELGAHAKANTISNFAITWDDKGGFVLKETEAAPHFLIVSEMFIREEPTASSVEAPTKSGAKAMGTSGDVKGVTSDTHRGMRTASVGEEYPDVAKKRAESIRYSVFIYRPSEEALARLR